MWSAPHSSIIPRSLTQPLARLYHLAHCAPIRPTTWLPMAPPGTTAPRQAYHGPTAPIIFEALMVPKHSLLWPTTAPDSPYCAYHLVLMRQHQFLLCLPRSHSSYCAYHVSMRSTPGSVAPSTTAPQPLLGLPRSL
jgi:hypothetical protein